MKITTNMGSKISTKLLTYAQITANPGVYIPDGKEDMRVIIAYGVRLFVYCDGVSTLIDKYWEDTKFVLASEPITITFEN